MKGLLLKGYEKIVTFGRSGKETTTIDEIKEFVSGSLSDDFVNKFEKGQKNGVASLDSNGKVPLNQLPPSSGGGGGFSLIEYNPKEYEISTPKNLEFTSYGSSNNITATNSIPLGNLSTLPVQLVNPITSEQYDTQIQHSTYVAYLSGEDIGEITLDFTNVVNAHVFITMLWVDKSPPDSNSIVNRLFYTPPSQMEYANVNSSGVGITQRPKTSGSTTVVVLDSNGNSVTHQEGDNLVVSLRHGVLLNKLAELQGMSVDEVIDLINQTYSPDEARQLVDGLRRSRFVSGSLDNEYHEEHETSSDLRLQVIFVPTGTYNEETGMWLDLTVENMTGEVAVSHTFERTVNKIPTGLPDGTYLKINGEANINGKTLTTGDFVQVYDNDKIITHRQ